MTEERSKSRIWDQAAKDIRIFAESIVDTIREPLVILDGDLNVVIANPAFYRKFLVNRSETEGRRIYDLGGGQWDIPSLRKLLETINSKNEAIEDFEVEHDFPDLGHRIMHLNARRIEQQSGRNFILLTIEDVTDAVESRRSLEASEARYHHLVEEINSIIIQIDHDGRILFFNRFSEHIFGYSRNELIGKQLVGTVLPETDSEGRDNTGLISGVLRDPDQYYFNENVGLKKDGTEVFFSWSARRVEDPKKHITILIDGNDITQEREARRAARDAHKIINEAGSAIIRIDHEKNFQFVNRSFAELVGKTVKEIEGTKLSDANLPASTLKKVKEAVYIAARLDTEQIFETSYGARHILVRVEPDYEKGLLSGFDIFFNDITERKQMEEDLRKSRNRLEEQVRKRTSELEKLNEALKKEIERRKKFDTDLKLQNKKILKEQEQRKYLSKKLVEMLEKERQAIAESLHNDVGQILAKLHMDLDNAIDSEEHASIKADTLVKIQNSIMESMNYVSWLSGSLRPHILENLGLVPAIRNMLNKIKENSNIHFDLYAERFFLQINDEKALSIYRIVQEAVTNCLKHAGAKKIIVNLIRKDDFLSVIIEDDGTGFEYDKISAGEEKEKLGLSIMNERALQIGGEFCVESQVGKGTRVIVEVPVE